MFSAIFCVTSIQEDAENTILDSSDSELHLGQYKVKSVATRDTGIHTLIMQGGKGAVG